MDNVKIPKKFSVNSYELQCEWHDCQEKFVELFPFFKHVRWHIFETIPDYADVIECKKDINANLHCEWQKCSFEANSQSNYIRHVLFHAYHTKLKSIGRLLLRINEQICNLDSFSSNILPEPLERPICCWGNCDFKSEDHTSFYQHIQYHLNEGDQNINKIYKCKWKDCNLEYKVRRTLAEHLRTHTHEKVIACPTCGSLYVTRSKFLDHIKRQVTEETSSIKCPYCPFITATMGNLKKHINYKHSDDKPYICDKCPMACKSRYDLQKHIENIHSRENEQSFYFECPAQILTLIEGTIDHPRTMSVKCEFQCKSESILTRHLRLKHPDYDITAVAPTTDSSPLVSTSSSSYNPAIFYQQQQQQNYCTQQLTTQELLAKISPQRLGQPTHSSTPYWNMMDPQMMGGGMQINNNINNNNNNGGSSSSANLVNFISTFNDNSQNLDMFITPHHHHHPPPPPPQNNNNNYVYPHPLLDNLQSLTNSNAAVMAAASAFITQNNNLNNNNPLSSAIYATSSIICSSVNNTSMKTTNTLTSSINNTRGTTATTTKSHHKRAQNPPNLRYLCHLCDKKYSRSDKLSNHLQRIHNFTYHNQRFRRYQLYEDGNYRVKPVLILAFETANSSSASVNNNNNNNNNIGIGKPEGTDAENNTRAAEIDVHLHTPHNLKEEQTTSPSANIISNKRPPDLSSASVSDTNILPTLITSLNDDDVDSEGEEEKEDSDRITACINRVVKHFIPKYRPQLIPSQPNITPYEKNGADKSYHVVNVPNQRGGQHLQHQINIAVEQERQQRYQFSSASQQHQLSSATPSFNPALPNGHPRHIPSPLISVREGGTAYPNLFQLNSHQHSHLINPLPFSTYHQDLNLRPSMMPPSAGFPNVAAASHNIPVLPPGLLGAATAHHPHPHNVIPADYAAAVNEMLNFSRSQTIHNNNVAPLPSHNHHHHQNFTSGAPQPTTADFSHHHQLYPLSFLVNNNNNFLNMQIGGATTAAPAPSSLNSTIMMDPSIAFESNKCLDLDNIIKWPNSNLNKLAATNDLLLSSLSVLNAAAAANNNNSNSYKKMAASADFNISSLLPNAATSAGAHFSGNLGPPLLLQQQNHHHQESLNRRIDEDFKSGGDNINSALIGGIQQFDYVLAKSHGLLGGKSHQHPLNASQNFKNDLSPIANLRGGGGREVSLGCQNESRLRVQQQQRPDASASNILLKQYQQEGIGTVLKLGSNNSPSAVTSLNQTTLLNLCTTTTATNNNNNSNNQQQQLLYQNLLQQHYHQQQQSSLLFAATNQQVVPNFTLQSSANQQQQQSQLPNYHLHHHPHHNNQLDLNLISALTANNFLSSTLNAAAAAAAIEMPADRGAKINNQNNNNNETLTPSTTTSLSLSLNNNTTYQMLNPVRFHE